ncbi:MAG: MmgE/PrpD family protein [Pseudorhodoplanes sp.]
MSEKRSVTFELARWAASPDLRLPPPVLEHTRLALLNIAGCILGGCHHEAVDASLRALSVGGATGNTPVIGRTERLSKLEAAYINSLSSTLHTFDDTHLHSVVHPTGPSAAALYSLIESGEFSSDEFLVALAVGIEVSCRLGSLLTQPPARSHVGAFLTGLTCGVGAAAACGRLLRLDDVTMTSALGCAMQHSSGTRASHGTHGGAIAPALAARGGLYSALLAAEGFDGGQHGLDGPNGFAQLHGSVPPDAVLNGLGTRYELLDVTFKPYPCGVVIHPAIDAGLMLYGRIAYDDIERIEVKSHPLVLRLTGKRHPSNGFEAKASVFHWLAVAVARGTAELQDATEERVSDPMIGALRDRIFVTTDETLASDEMRLNFVRRSGEETAIHIDHATGSIQNPMRPDQLRLKFMGQAVPVIGSDSSSRFADACLRPSDDDSLIHALRALMNATKGH